MPKQRFLLSELLPGGFGPLIVSVDDVWVDGKHYELDSDGIWLTESPETPDQRERRIALVQALEADHA